MNADVFRSWAQRLKRWLGWGEPIVIKIETRRSPDWNDTRDTAHKGKRST